MTDTTPKPVPDAKKAAAKNAAASKRAAAAAKRAAGQAEPPRRPGAPSKAQKRAEHVAGLYQSMGLGLTMAGGLAGSEALVADGQVLADEATARAIGQAWADLADQNNAVAKWLDALTQSSAWGAVIMAHVPIVLAIQANHAPALPAPEPAAA